MGALLRKMFRICFNKVWNKRKDQKPFKNKIFICIFPHFKRFLLFTQIHQNEKCHCHTCNKYDNMFWHDRVIPVKNNTEVNNATNTFGNPWSWINIVFIQAE